MNTKNTFKAVLAATTIMSASLGAMAHPYRGYRVVPCGPAPMHHHHHHGHHDREILGVGLGLFGVGLIANAFSKPEKETVVVQQPVVVQQTPVVVQQQTPPVVVQQTPVVVQQTPVVKQPQPKYVTRQYLEWNGKEYVQRTVTELVYE